MGFHKTYIDIERTIFELSKNNLSFLYKNDILIFDDKLSSDVYNMYKQGYTNDKIINFLNTKKNEMYQIN